MCGILGIVVNEKNGIYRKLLDIFIEQEHRGIEGGGLILKRNDKIIRMRTHHPYYLFSCDKYKFWNSIQKGDIILIHHRMPSSNHNHYDIKTNHPFKNCNNDVYLIHNGVINNYKELYEKMKNHHVFESESNNNITDSEILVHMIEHDKLNDKRIKKCIKKIHKKVNGSLTFAFVTKYNNCIYLFKRDNPLFVYQDKLGNWYFSSEHHALWSKNVINLENNSLYKLDSDGLTQLIKFKEKRRFVWFWNHKTNRWNKIEHGNYSYHGGYNWDIGYYG